MLNNSFKENRIFSELIHKNSVNAESKTRQRHHQKMWGGEGNYWSISMKNINTKNFDQISANLI